MISGIYSAASGMVCQEKKTDVISQNIMGAAAPGFKKTTPIFMPFDNVLRQAQGAGGRGVKHVGDYVSHGAGEMRRTKQALDFCIDGEGYFVVQTTSGPLYTRNGRFSLGPNGKLVSGRGFPVLGDRGEIFLPEGEAKADKKGNITVGGTSVGQLKIVRFDRKSDLTPVGGAYFRADSSARPMPSEEAGVQQGFIEMSNVSIFEEMTDMVYTMRCYETCQKMVAMQDDTLNKVINEVGNMA